MGATWRKAQAVEEILARFEGKVIVFCEFRATIAALLERLRRGGIAALPFHGGMNQVARSKTIERFRDEVRVLVSSKAGAEGLNIQFCSTVVNFDLPWNPQQIEQRIGRIQRLGSKHREVYVFNLMARGTIATVPLSRAARCADPRRTAHDNARGRAVYMQHSA